LIYFIKFKIKTKPAEELVPRIKNLRN